LDRKKNAWGGYIIGAGLIFFLVIVGEIEDSHLLKVGTTDLIMLHMQCEAFGNCIATSRAAFQSIKMNRVYPFLWLFRLYN
jgi:hypothetical protein